MDNLLVLPKELFSVAADSEGVLIGSGSEEAYMDKECAIKVALLILDYYNVEGKPQ